MSGLEQVYLKLRPYGFETIGVDSDNDLTKSELKIELINVTETGYESLWLGAYYVNNTIYLNLEDAFNIQKVAIGGLNIAEILKDYIIDFDTEKALRLL